MGAPDYDAGQAGGAAFVFAGSASGIASGTPASASAVIGSDQAAAYLGGDVAGAGDVNGDGHRDLIVGAPFYDAGQTDEGAVFVFLGSASGIASATPATAAARLESNQANAELGANGAGDVNGDGYSDVIAAAPLYDAGQNNEGAAFVYLPEPTRVPSLAGGLALVAALGRGRGPRRLQSEASSSATSRVASA